MIHDLGNALQLDFPDVLFEPRKATLAPAAADIAHQIAEVIRKNPGKQIRIEGHTDNTGSPDFNERLSRERAESVRRALVAEGLSSDLIEVQGFGSSRPIASNDTAEGRSKNRRVVVLIPK